LDEVFEAVAAEASSILSGRSAHLVQFDDGSATVVATCNSPVPLGLRTPTDDGTINATLLRTRQAVRVPILTGAAARLAEGLGVNTLVIVPVIAEGRVWGALATTGDQPLPANTEHRLTEFAEIAAAAIANAENKAALLASRARIVATANETRQQMQRDVHDGVQQRLVQTVLTLHLALEASAKGAETADLVREALQTAERATDELRDLVQGILPASLTRGGLRAGLESLLAGLALPVSLDMAAKPLERMAPNVEVTAYFVVAEGLTNAVKHARAQHARVSVAADDDALIVEVADDGVGGADPGRGSGLTGLMDRVDAMRGTLTLTSAAGSGTTIRVTLPLRG
jgi:signal transduction histidine kinase